MCNFTFIFSQNMKKTHLLLLLLPFLLISCYKKWDPRKYRQVEIVDPGEIYSTLNLEKRNDNNKTIFRNFLLKKRWLPDSLFRTISSSCNESKWVTPLKTPQNRLDNRGKLRQYKAYLVTKFKGKYIVYIPSKENGRSSKTLPQDFITDRDIYMIISPSGIEKMEKDSVLHGFETWERPPRKKIRADIKKALGTQSGNSGSGKTGPATRNPQDGRQEGMPPRKGEMQEREQKPK